MKDVVHEALKSRWGVGEAEWHDLPFKRSIARVESGFPFVSFGNMNEVVGMLEVEGCVDSSFSGGLEKVGNQRKRIVVLFRDLIETSVIDTKTKGSIFLVDEEDGCAMRGRGRSNEANGQVFVNELAEGLEFGWRERVDRTERRLSSFFNLDLEVVRTVGSKCVCFLFAEDIGVIVVFFGNLAQVGGVGSRSRFGGNGRGVGEVESKGLRTWELTSFEESCSINKPDVRRCGGVFGRSGRQRILRRKQGCPGGGVRHRSWIRSV